MIKFSDLPKWIADAITCIGIKKEQYEGGLIEIEMLLGIAASTADIDSSKLATVAEAVPEVWTGAAKSSYQPQVGWLVDFLLTEAAVGQEVLEYSSQQLKFLLRSMSFESKKHAEDARTLAKAVGSYRDQLNLISAYQTASSFKDLIGKP